MICLSILNSSPILRISGNTPAPFPNPTMHKEKKQPKQIITRDNHTISPNSAARNCYPELSPSGLRLIQPWQWSLFASTNSFSSSSSSSSCIHPSSPSPYPITRLLFYSRNLWSIMESWIPGIQNQSPILVLTSGKASCASMELFQASSYRTCLSLEPSMSKHYVRLPDLQASLFRTIFSQVRSQNLINSVL